MKLKVKILSIILLSFIIKVYNQSHIGFKIQKIPFQAGNISFLDFDIYKKRYIYNENGNVHIYENSKLKYKKAENVIDKIQNYYIVERNKKYGILDKNLDTKLEAQYDKIADSGIKDYIIIEKDKKMGLLNIDNLKINNIYDYIKKVDENSMLKISKNKKYGYLNKKREILIEPQYKILFPFKKNLAVASFDGKKYGVIDIHGKEVLPFEFQEIYLHKNGNILTV